MVFLGALAFRARDVAGPVNSLRTKGLRASAQSICLGHCSSPPICNQFGVELPCGGAASFWRS